MRIHLIVAIFLGSSLLFITQGANILGIFPYPAKSHVAVTNAVLKNLAGVGHEISVITSFPHDLAKENYTSIIDLSEGEVMQVSSFSVKDDMNLHNMAEFVVEIEMSLCGKVYNLKEIQDAIHSKKKIFDLMIVELIVLHRCYYWIAKKLNIPTISIVTSRSSLIADLEISNPRSLATIPFEYGSTLDPKHFYDRFINVIETSELLLYWYTTIKEYYQQFHQKFVKDGTSFDEFMDYKPSLIFINSHYSYFPRPLNPNIIEIGGIHINQNKPLPKSIQEFLDSAEHGAILFSFGSIVRAAKIPYNKIQAFVEAFAEIPQKVIWKYEEKLEGLSKNVMILEWLPQSDILAHKNIKAFISHCGQGAVHESLYHGIPVIASPLMYDQHVNGDIFLKLGIAVRLEYKSVSKENILQALHEIINNTKYYEKMKELSNSFIERPISPQQLAVYWSEYVIRHKGAPHLRTSAAELHWYQYYLLDVISAIILFSFVILCVMCFTVKLFYSFITSKISNQEKLKSS